LLCDVLLLTMSPELLEEKAMRLSRLPQVFPALREA
jgi:hypothetical protein